MDIEEQTKKNHKAISVNSEHLSLQNLYPTPPLKVSALWKRPTFYSEGSGVKLKHIPTVAAAIEAAPQSFIEIMHYLLYLHIDEKSNLHRNILEFSGLKCDIGSVNYVCRMRMLSVFSVDQLVLICRVLCLPVWEYARQILVDSIINFLLVPQMIELKGKVTAISSEEFITTFDFPKVIEIMLQEAKAAGMEEIKILSDVHISEETANVSCKETSSSLENKTNQMKRMESKPTEAEQREIVPDIRVSDQTSVMTPFSHHLVEGVNYFSKSMDVPDVLQSCQNYDFRYQRELLKSGVTLNLNPDDYLEQAIGEDDTAFRLACAKYLKNYHHTDHHQQLTKSHHCRETEEQAAIRRAQNAQRMRNYRQSLRSLETEQQAAERRAQNALRMRNYRKFKRELEPELAAERRAQNAERMRNYRKVKRELEPEKAARRRAQNALRMRNYRKNKRLQESE